MGREFDHRSRFDMHQRCDAFTQLITGNARRQRGLHLEVKAQTVKKGKGGWEVPVLEYYKCEEQPEQNVKREAQE